jgi:Methyltransferase domain
VFNFWDVAIRSVLSAIRPKTVVEIGAEEGVHTIRLVQWAAENRAVLHCIDPKPRFDVAALERAYPKRFVMHCALSLEALPSIKAPDAVLIDGDHNWYTVSEELRLLNQSSRRWPLVLLHDVGWPYGRRDMYYDPDTIPAEARQDYKRSGMVKGRSKLSSNGANPTYANASHEGGSRNGVLTAVEDFMDESERRLELFVVRGAGGLALLIERTDLKSRVRPVVKRVHDHALGVELSPRYVSRYFD